MGPSRNWLKTKNYAEVELPILGVVQEAGKPTLALLGNNNKDRTYIGSASVVGSDKTGTLTRSGARQQAQPRPVLARGRVLIDPDRKRPDDNMRWLNPGLVGRVRYLWGSSGLRHATVMSFWLEDGSV